MSLIREDFDVFSGVFLEVLVSVFFVFLADVLLAVLLAVFLAVLLVDILAVFFLADAAAVLVFAGEFARFLAIGVTG
jgi:hypothetical protein